MWCFFFSPWVYWCSPCVLRRGGPLLGSRAMVGTVIIGSHIRCGIDDFFLSCNFLGLLTRDFSNYLEVCLARVLSGCLVVRPSFSRPCSCVLWPVFCTSRFLGDRCLVGGDHLDLTALACVLLSSPIPVFSVDPAAIKEDGSVVTWGRSWSSRGTLWSKSLWWVYGSVVTWGNDWPWSFWWVLLSSNSSRSVSCNVFLFVVCLSAPFSLRWVGVSGDRHHERMCSWTAASHSPGCLSACLLGTSSTIWRLALHVFCLVVWLCDLLNCALAPVSSGRFPVLGDRFSFLVQITTISLPSLVFFFSTLEISVITQVDLDAPVEMVGWTLYGEQRSLWRSKCIVWIRVLSGFVQEFDHDATRQQFETGRFRVLMKPRNVSVESCSFTLSFTGLHARASEVLKSRNVRENVWTALGLLHPCWRILYWMRCTRLHTPPHGETIRGKKQRESFVAINVPKIVNSAVFHILSTELRQITSVVSGTTVHWARTVDHDVQRDDGKWIRPVFFEKLRARQFEVYQELNLLWQSLLQIGQERQSLLSHSHLPAEAIEGVEDGALETWVSWDLKSFDLNFCCDVLFKFFPLCDGQISCPSASCAWGVPDDSAGQHLFAELVKTTFVFLRHGSALTVEWCVKSLHIRCSSVCWWI